MVGLLGRVISPSQGLYLHRTTHDRKTRTNIHAFSGIQPHDPSSKPAKTHTSDRTATVTGKRLHTKEKTVKIVVFCSRILFISFLEIRQDKQFSN
jgi:hypothetical protein